MTRAARFAFLLLAAVGGAACHSDAGGGGKGGAGGRGAAGAGGGSAGASGIGGGAAGAAGMASGGSAGGGSGASGGLGGGGLGGGGSGGGGSGGGGLGGGGSGGGGSGGGGSGGGGTGGGAAGRGGSNGGGGGGSNGGAGAGGTGGGPLCTLGTATDCAACGDPACALANTLLACTSADRCAHAPCAAGFANCNTSSPDCETSFATGGTCLPTYRGTAPFPMTSTYFNSTAIATDGSYFLAGQFGGSVDFDPTSAQDVHTAGAAGNVAAFITKMNADGSYAWTQIFEGTNVAFTSLAPAANGGVVAVGEFLWSVDLDPGPRVEMHNAGLMANSGRQAVVVKLAANGSLVWGRNFVEGTTYRSYSSATSVAVDATDAVYMAGIFTQLVDFDPGPGTVLRTAPFVAGAFLVKLTAAGDFAWAQTFDDGDYCPARLDGVTVASDGTVWAAGLIGVHPTCENQFAKGPNLQPLVMAYSSGGTARGSWRMPPSDASAQVSSIAAGTNGSVYVGGEASGSIDFDPGLGVAMRWAGPYPSSFVVKLGPDASFQWAQTFPAIWPGGLAAASDGGVLTTGSVTRGDGSVAGTAAVVTKLGADGASGWTFALGGVDTTADDVAARGNTFVVAGANMISGAEDGAADFDPGAGTQILAGNLRFLSRFTF